MSVPFSFHAVSKVRENMQKDNTAGASASSSKQATGWQAGQKSSELQSYSSKMMKAIWGQYNRYSVHNFKSNQTPAGAAGAGAGAGAAGAGRSSSPERRLDGRAQAGHAGVGMFSSQ